MLLTANQIPDNRILGIDWLAALAALTSETYYNPPIRVTQVGLLSRALIDKLDIVLQ